MRKKVAKKEDLEKDLDFNSGFEHGFNGLAEYKSQESNEKPKSKVTSEQSKGASSAVSQP